MNRSIVRLFGVVVLMFTVLIVWTSRWTVFSATALQHNSLNSLQFYASLKVKRGEILAGNEVLAKSVKAKGGTWNRVYPQGSLFAQVVGYYFPERGQPPYGLESARNSELSGPKSALASVFGSFNGTPTVGDDVHTTIDPKAQARARQLLNQTIASTGAISGSVVAIVPKTGAVKVLYSYPSYNDNRPNKCKLPGCQVYFDATQGLYPPGSTFKLVTSTAALDTGRATPDSTFSGKSPITISGHSLENDNDDNYGQVSLTNALTYSINTVFAPLGLSLGGNVMQKYMRRYGFYSVPPLDYPADQMKRSGTWFYKGSCGIRSNTPKLLPVTNACVDLGRTSIGQANLTVTPLQMAMVVSAIANDGKLMEPRLTSKVVNNAGQVVETISPQEYDRVMKPKIAGELQQMMRKVVEEGTGTAANLEGLSIAGKTGTASLGTYKDGQPLDDAWFVGFPLDNPKIAVAVELTAIKNGYGGQFAAPIAAKVIQTLLTEKP